MMATTDLHMAEANWNSLYRLGAVAALLAVLFAVLEILITLIPGGERVAPELLTVPLWFARLQANPLLELRNLGLVNIFLTAFGLLLAFALFAAHRMVNPGWAGLALVIAAIGGAVFFATNRSFAMLALSNRYATSSDEAQRADLVAAGEAMLAVGASHTRHLPGLCPELAGQFADGLGNAARRHLQPGQCLCWHAGLWIPADL
jgi:hypothetical protein